MAALRKLRLTPEQLGEVQQIIYNLIRIDADDKIYESNRRIHESKKRRNQLKRIARGRTAELIGTLFDDDKTETPNDHEPCSSASVIQPEKNEESAQVLENAVQAPEISETSSDLGFESGKESLSGEDEGPEGKDDKDPESLTESERNTPVPEDFSPVYGQKTGSQSSESQVLEMKRPTAEPETIKVPVKMKVSLQLKSEKNREQKELKDPGKLPLAKTAKFEQGSAKRLTGKMDWAAHLKHVTPQTATKAKRRPTEKPLEAHLKHVTPQTTTTKAKRRPTEKPLESLEHLEQLDSEKPLGSFVRNRSSLRQKPANNTLSPIGRNSINRKRDKTVSISVPIIKDQRPLILKAKLPNGSAASQKFEQKVMEIIRKPHSVRNGKLENARSKPGFETEKKIPVVTKQSQPLKEAMEKSKTTQALKKADSLTKEKLGDAEEKRGTNQLAQKSSPVQPKRAPLPWMKEKATPMNLVRSPFKKDVARVPEKDISGAKSSTSLCRSKTPATPGNIADKKNVSQETVSTIVTTKKPPANLTPVPLLKQETLGKFFLKPKTQPSTQQISPSAASSPDPTTKGHNSNTHFTDAEETCITGKLPAFSTNPLKSIRRAKTSKIPNQPEPLQPENLSPLPAVKDVKTRNEASIMTQAKNAPKKEHANQKLASNSTESEAQGIADGPTKIIHSKPRQKLAYGKGGLRPETAPVSLPTEENPMENAQFPRFLRLRSPQRLPNTTNENSTELPPTLIIRATPLQIDRQLEGIEENPLKNVVLKTVPKFPGFLESRYRLDRYGRVRKSIARRSQRLRK